MAPAMGTAKAPCELSISELNSMAFGLAVYASQDGLPRHHARLASGRWSGATGRAFHPQGSYERFQSCILTSHPPFPSFAWHNVHDRRRKRQLANCVRPRTPPRRNGPAAPDHRQIVPNSCAKCGAATEITEAGWQRDCLTCHASHFPRTDPVVIMLITHGNNVLLGRSPAWPDKMYSLLAGFMEPGETIEAAVRREVLEESSITVGNVGYMTSQPWPFPSSLMIGCYGTATSTTIKLDENELDDAQWVSKEKIVDVLCGNSDDILPSRKGSIAQFLIENWIKDSID